VRRGFSLIELIIVIGLIALLGSLVVVNANAILSGLGDEPVETTLLKAVREGRFQSAALKETTRLSYDEELPGFRLRSESGRELAAFPLEIEKNALDVTFEQILPAEGLLRQSNEETAPLPAVAFRPDRSSTPFEVIFKFRTETFTQRFDPFSAIVIKDSRESN
jgi:prepilin-type N-terminal cleavage/methylation domain-containing protein